MRDFCVCLVVSLFLCGCKQHQETASVPPGPLPMPVATNNPTEDSEPHPTQPTVTTEFRDRIEAIRAACVKGNRSEFHLAVSDAQDYFDLYQSQLNQWSNDFHTIHHVATFVIGFWDWHDEEGDSIILDGSTSEYLEGAQVIDPNRSLSRTQASCAKYVGAGLAKINGQCQALLGALDKTR
jgi:hypothetical protein